MKLAGSLMLAIAVTFAVLWIPSIPLGVPGEWIWPRHAMPMDAAEAAERLFWPVVSGTLLTIVCRAVDRRLGRMRSGSCCLCVGLLAVGMLWWMNAVRQAAPSPHRELRPLWVLYDRFATGYFHKACFSVRSQGELLRTYESRMAEGDVLHEGTHPPGLYLFSWWALRATAGSEALQTFAKWTQPAASISLFRTLEAEAAMARPLTDPELSALCLQSFVSRVLTALTVIPVFGLTCLVAGRRTAWRAACLVMTLPALSVFAPRSDAVYAFSASLLLWLMVLSWVESRPLVRMAAAVGAGSWGFVCLLTSLAHLPVIVAGLGCGMAMSVLPEGHPPSSDPGKLPSGLPQRGAVVRWQGLLWTGGLMLLTGILLVVVFQLLTGCALFKVWQLNLRNHAAFYGTSPRSYGFWLIVNPLELSFSTGLPVMGLAVSAVVSGVRRIVGLLSSARSSADDPSGPEAPALILVLVTSATWMVLWLSGKNLGEAARLWCFLTPWFTMSAAVGLLLPGWSCVREKSGTANRSAPVLIAEAVTEHSWWWLLAAQFAVCTLTVGMVSGYLQL